MKEQEIFSIRQRIYDLLSVKRLKEALAGLDTLVKTSGNVAWVSEQEQLNTTYKYMLRYTLEGIRDPERQKIYRKLVRDTYELTDRTVAGLFHPDSGQYVQKRKAEMEGDPETKPFISKLSIYLDWIHRDREHYVDGLSRLFKLLWLQDEFDDQLKEVFQKCMASEEWNAGEKTLLVSALNMSLLRYFDRKKFDMLFDSMEMEDEEIRVRALFGILLAFFQYDERLIYYPAIRSRFLVMEETPDFKALVREIIVQLIRSKDTEKLTRRMQTEILPEMIKLSPQVRARLDLDKLLTDSLADDKNPEWERILDDSPGLKDKMQELTEMQMEGDDVFMSSFAMLKGFPFFRNMVNWFFPFMKDHPDVAGEWDQGAQGPGEESDSGGIQMEQFLDSVSKSFYLCNSDKYSICFGIRSMPPDMQKFLSDGLKAESEQMKEILQDEVLLDRLQQPRRIIRQYSQDLYRFFKLFQDRHGFTDIFSWKMDFFRKSFFQNLYQDDPKVYYTLGEFYLEKKNWKEAAEVFNFLADLGDQSATLLQKLAWSYQKLEDHEKALHFYLKADLMLPENVWNLKKIGLCYRFLRQPEKALQYYRQAELFDTEDLNTEVSIGHCLLDTQQYEEALRSYFKVEYLAPQNTRVWRPIAWCSFILGKFEQARKYYGKLVEMNPNRFDLINLGHLEWCEGNRAKALEWYHQSISRNESDPEEFMTLFAQDQEHLVRHGVDPEDIPILLDQLRYML